MRWSHLPVECYAGIAAQSDDRCRTLARRPGGSRHLRGFGVRSKLRGEVEGVSGSANKQRQKMFVGFPKCKDSFSSYPGLVGSPQPEAVRGSGQQTPHRALQLRAVVDLGRLGAALAHLQTEHALLTHALGRRRVCGAEGGSKKKKKRKKGIRQWGWKTPG